MGGVMCDPVCWPDAVDDVIRGDITAAAAYLTPAGGAVVTAVAPCGIGRRDAGVVGFTTSLGFDKKLERVIVDIAVWRVAAWPDPSAARDMQVTGAGWPGPADPQSPPKNGTGPRVD